MGIGRNLDHKLMYTGAAFTLVPEHTSALIHRVTLGGSVLLVLLVIITRQFNLGYSVLETFTI